MNRYVYLLAAAVLLPSSWTRAAEPAVAFTRGPAVEACEGGVRIAFALSRPTDVAVYIEDAAGKVVRHLAAGVLGPNAPAPFRPGSLEQSLLWDGTDDLGRPAAKQPGYVSPFRVRVGAGLEVRHAGTAFDEHAGPNGIVNVVGLAAGADGRVYVLSNRWGRYSWQDTAVSVYRRDGSYERTIKPFPADLPAERVKPAGAFRTEEGEFVPIIHRVLGTTYYPCEDRLPQQMAVTKEGHLILAVVDPALNAIYKGMSARLAVIDREGHPLLAECIKPPGKPYPDLFQGRLPSKQVEREYVWMYGSVVKFGPEGGAVWFPKNYNINTRKHYPYPFDGKPDLPSSLGKEKVAGTRGTYFIRELTLQGAKWWRYGCAYLLDMAGRGTDRCHCTACEFDVDDFGRVFFPDQGRFRVTVLDTNGNLITHVGGYGNQDYCGPASYVLDPQGHYLRPRRPDDPEIPPEPKSKLGRAEVFSPKLHGVVCWRSSWEPDATVIHFKCGDNVDHHATCDAGKFTVFKYAPLAIKNGHYRGYKSSKHWYYKSAWSANVVVFDNPRTHGYQPYVDFDGYVTWQTWQERRRKYKFPPTGRLLETEANERYARALGDLTGATWPTGSSWQRELVFLGYKYLLVLDRVKPGKDTTTRWLLHSIEEPRIDTTDRLAIIDNGRGRLFVKVPLPEGARMEKVGGKERAFVHKTRSGAERSWPFYRAKKPGAQLGAGRLDVVPADPAAECIYLVVLYPTDVGTTEMPPCSVEREDGDLVVHVGEYVYRFTPPGGGRRRPSR